MHFGIGIWASHRSCICVPGVYACNTGTLGTRSGAGTPHMCGGSYTPNRTDSIYLPACVLPSWGFCPSSNRLHIPRERGGVLKGWGAVDFEYICIRISGNPNIHRAEEISKRAYGYESGLGNACCERPCYPLVVQMPPESPGANLHTLGRCGGESHIDLHLLPHSEDLPIEHMHSILSGEGDVDSPVVGFVPPCWFAIAGACYKD